MPIPDALITRWREGLLAVAASMIVPVLIVVGLLVALEYAQPREAGQSPGGVWPLFVGIGVGYAFLIRAFRLWVYTDGPDLFPLDVVDRTVRGPYHRSLPWLRVIVGEPPARHIEPSSADSGTIVPNDNHALTGQSIERIRNFCRGLRV